MFYEVWSPGLTPGIIIEFNRCQRILHPAVFSGLELLFAHTIRALALFLLGSGDLTFSETKKLLRFFSLKFKIKSVINQSLSEHTQTVFNFFDQFLAEVPSCCFESARD